MRDRGLSFFARGNFGNFGQKWAPWTDPRQHLDLLVWLAGCSFPSAESVSTKLTYKVYIPLCWPIDLQGLYTSFLAIISSHMKIFLALEGWFMFIVHRFYIKILCEVLSIWEKTCIDADEFLQSLNYHTHYENLKFESFHS